MKKIIFFIKFLVFIPCRILMDICFYLADTYHFVKKH